MRAAKTEDLQRLMGQRGHPRHGSSSREANVTTDSVLSQGRELLANKHCRRKDHCVKGRCPKTELSLKHPTGGALPPSRKLQRRDGSRAERLHRGKLWTARPGVQLFEWPVITLQEVRLLPYRRYRGICGFKLASDHEKTHGG